MTATQTVTPHLVVNDANAAIEFYKKGLGATEALRMPAQDGKRLMHAEIHVGGARFFVVDDFPEFRGMHGGENWKTPQELGGTSVTIQWKLPTATRRSSVWRMPARKSHYHRGMRSGARAMARCSIRSATSGASPIRCRRSRDSLLPRSGAAFQGDAKHRRS